MPRLMLIAMINKNKTNAIENKASSIRGGDFQWGLKEFKPTKKMLEAMKKTK